MNENLYSLLPNPYAVDYQHADGPMDLYRDQEMARFAERLLVECCAMINAHIQHNNPHDCMLVLNIKEHFGIDQ